MWAITLVSLSSKGTIPVGIIWVRTSIAVRKSLELECPKNNCQKNVSEIDPKVVLKVALKVVLKAVIKKLP